MYKKLDRKNLKNISYLFFEKILSDNQLGIGIYCISDLTLVHANQCYMNYLNKSDSIVGKKISEINEEWEGGNEQELWDYLILKGETVYFSEHTDFNDQYWEKSLIPITEDGTVKYIITVLNNITKQVLNRKHIEEKNKIIEQQKEQLEAIIENMSDALFIFDNDSKYNRMNKSARKLYYGDMEGRNDNSSQFFSLDVLMQNLKIPEENHPVLRILNRNRVSDYDATFKTPGGDKQISINGTPIFDRAGNFSMGVLCCKDMTEKSQLDEMLLNIEKEKNEVLENAINMKDEFLTIVSHEFRTPLTVIYSAIQTMELICKNEFSEKSKLFIMKIRQNVLRQLRLVNNLLDITRANAGHIRLSRKNIDIVFLTKAIFDSVVIYAQPKEIEMSFTSVLSGKIVGIDDEKFERIILNLLSNAIKFTPKGKSIRLKLYQKQGAIFIDVEDEGIGIPEDKQVVIFERFGQVDSSLTRQAEGTGIGLNLVKILVESMDGKISLHSKEGVGSTFTVQFPILKLEETEINREVSEETANNRLIQSLNIEFSDIYLSKVV